MIEHISAWYLRAEDSFNRNLKNEQISKTMSVRKKWHNHTNSEKEKARYNEGVIAIDVSRI